MASGISSQLTTQTKICLHYRVRDINKECTHFERRKEDLTVCLESSSFIQVWQLSFAKIE